MGLIIDSTGIPLNGDARAFGLLSRILRSYTQLQGNLLEQQAGLPPYVVSLSSVINAISCYHYPSLLHQMCKFKSY